MKSKVPSKTLVVAADDSVARFFGFLRAENRLAEFLTMSNPQARLKEQMLISDSPGRAFDSVGAGRHQLEQRGSREHNAERFAATVADKIDALCANENVYRLAVVAAPRFLGRLRPQLSAHSRSLLVAEIDKEMATDSADEILLATADYLLAPLSD